MVTRVSLSLVVVLALGCGAKTGLALPDPMDAGMRDAGPRQDAGRRDAGELPEECVAIPVVLARRRAEVLFVIDRSFSMTSRPDGEPAETPIESRWVALREALVGALLPRDEDLDVGALFYPDATLFGGNIEVACSVVEEIDLVPGPRNARALIDQIEARSPPQGATPTAAALEIADRFFTSVEDREAAKFVVLATDGGPNCNEEPVVPPPMCTCTSTDESFCDPAVTTAAPYYCLDDDGSVEAVERIANDDVPVFVVGITDEEDAEPFRMTLDRLAIAGGRPRPAGGPRYYDVTSADELASAMNVIADSISRCTFYLPIDWRVSDVERLSIDDAPIGRDPTRTNGWDLTDRERGEVTLYGAACDAGAALDAQIFALPICEP